MSRVFLVAALLLTGVVDWILPFPETQPGLRLTDEPVSGAGPGVWAPIPGGSSNLRDADEFPGATSGYSDMAAEWWMSSDSAGFRTIRRRPDRSRRGVGRTEAIDETVYWGSDNHRADSRSGRSGNASSQHPVLGLLTYYHPALAGSVMRDGATRYDPEGIGPIAMTNYELGTWVEICGSTGRCLMAVVSDTGLLAANHADVSEAMFRVLAGELSLGVAPVEIRPWP